MSFCTLSSISVSVYFLFYITFCQMLFKICPISNSESIINGKDIIYSWFNLTDLFLQTRFLTYFARICLLKWTFDRLFTIFGKINSITVYLYLWKLTSNWNEKHQKVYCCFTDLQPSFPSLDPLACTALSWINAFYDKSDNLLTND